MKVLPSGIRVCTKNHSKVSLAKELILNIHKDLQHKNQGQLHGFTVLAHWPKITPRKIQANPFYSLGIKKNSPAESVFSEMR